MYRINDAKIQALRTSLKEFLLNSGNLGQKVYYEHTIPKRMVSLHILDHSFDFEEHPFVVGIDPGRNLGAAFCLKRKLHLLFTSLPQSGDGGYKYLLSAYEFVHWFIARFGRPTLVVIEGASHNEQYGQDVLSQIRGVIDVAFEANDVPATQIPPLLLRKLAWGSGKSRPSDLFPHLNPHAVDALSGMVVGLSMV